MRATARKQICPPPTDWLSAVLAGSDGTAYAMAIHRYVDVQDWRSELEKVPEPLRAEAEKYLREIAQRMRVAREAKRK